MAYCGTRCTVDFHRKAFYCLPFSHLFHGSFPLIFPFSVSFSFITPLNWFMYFRQLPKVFTAQNLSTYLHCDVKGSHFEITTFPLNKKKKRFLVAMVMSAI